MEIQIKTPQPAAHVLVDFRCTFCASEESVNLVALARAGAVACGGCNRSLSLGQVSEAISRARRPAGSVQPRKRASRIYP